MYKTHMKEVEQGAELSPRPSFLEKSNGSGESYQLGKRLFVHDIVGSRKGVVNKKFHHILHT